MAPVFSFTVMSKTANCGVEKWTVSLTDKVFVCPFYKCWIIVSFIVILFYGKVFVVIPIKPVTDFHL